MTSFIKEVVNDTVKVNQKRKEDLRGSTCIPCVNGVLENIKSILTKAGVRVALKPVCTLANIFRIPKTRPSEERTKALAHKFECRTCSFTYIGESKRCWCSRWLEHKPGVRRNNHPAIKEHAETTGHSAAK